MSLCTRVNGQSVYVLRRGRHFHNGIGEGSHEAVDKLHPLVRVRRLAQDARLVEVTLALLGAVLTREVEATLRFELRVARHELGDNYKSYKSSKIKNFRVPTHRSFSKGLELDVEILTEVLVGWIELLGDESSRVFTQ